MGVRFAAARGVSAACTWGLKTVFKRPAGNFPGKMALYVDPKLLAHLAGKLRKGSVLVVGTNGKTTVTNLIADVLERSGEQVVCNRTGANLDSGVATTLLQASEGDWGVFETDELWLARVLPFVQADYVVLLDLFHDQMDRITEIELIQKSILRALESSPKTTLIYNADDPTCTFIAQKAKNPSIAFGMKEPLVLAGDAPAVMCQICDNLLEYRLHQYDHLGDYQCPHCGFRRPVLDYAVQNVRLDAQGASFTVRPAGLAALRSLHLHTTYNAAYMVYNMTAVAVAALQTGCPDACIQDVLAEFSPKNGRLERYCLNGRQVLLNLAKNPVGFNQNLSVISQDAGPKAVAFFVNDKEGDGRDVSWLWNVDFESLAAQGGGALAGSSASGSVGSFAGSSGDTSSDGDAGSFAKGTIDAEDACPEAEAAAAAPSDLAVFAGGMRAHDVVLRLKYAGIKAELVEDEQELLERLGALPSSWNAYLIGNYTALPGMKAALDHACASDARSDNGGMPDGDRSNKDALNRGVSGKGALDAQPAVCSDASDSSCACEDAEGTGRKRTWAADILRPLFHGVAHRGSEAGEDELPPVRMVDLYGDLLSLFGDCGNVRVLQKRLEWRGVPVEVVRVSHGQTCCLDDADLVLMGGSPDREQSLANTDLCTMKNELARYIENNGALLAIDGSYQMLGSSCYIDDEVQSGLGVLPLHSVAAQDLGEEDAAVGNIVVESPLVKQPLVGFENHRARTVLENGAEPFGRVTSKGCGNSEASKQDGVRYKNAIGTYLHGPLLSKNPELADVLLERALERYAQRTGRKLVLTDLDDAEEYAAREALL